MAEEPPAYTLETPDPDGKISDVQALYLKVKGMPTKRETRKATVEEREEWHPKCCQSCREYFCARDVSICKQRLVDGQNCHDWKLDTLRKSSYLTISGKSEMTVTCTNTNLDRKSGYCAFGTAAFFKGVTYIECRVDALGEECHISDLEDGKFRKHIVVGITGCVGSDTNKYPGIDEASVGWSNTCITQKGEATYPKMLEGIVMQAGDRIGMMLDLDNLSLSLLLNGRKLGEVEIPKGRYTPVFSCRVKGDKITVLPGAKLGATKS